LRRIASAAARPRGAAAPQRPSSPTGSGNCCAWSPPGTPTPRSPADWTCRRGPCAGTWKTSTAGSRSPAVPPPSPRAFPEQAAL